MAAVISPVSRWHDSGVMGVGPSLWYGPTALDGAAGDWLRAPLGSIYVQIDASGATAQTWQKIANAGATADWAAVVGMSGGNAELRAGLTTTGAVLTLGTLEPTVVVSDVLGRINFYAPLEASGTDAILVGASIAAVAEGTFTATANATSLIFQTGASEVAATKMTLTSAGYLGILGTPVTPLHVVGAATITGGIRPAADSTTALTLCKTDGTVVATVDTANTRFGIGATPTTTLHVVGAITVTGGIRPAANGTTALTLCNLAGTAIVTVDTTSSLAGINTTPATALHVAANEALAGNTTDDYAAAVTLDPAYTGDGIVATVTLNAAGTGYKDGDVLTVVQAGGAGCTVTAAVVSPYHDVATIGAITTAGLGYDVAVHATTGGTGAGCTISVDTIGGSGEIATATVSAGGTHYTVGDVLTIVAPGTGGTVTVATVGAGTGAVDSVTLLAAGTGYEVANALLTTGGTSPGAGAKINVTVLTARTVTRHNYIDVNQLALTKGAAVTGAALFRFDANAGTHKALLTGSTKTTPTGVDAWIPVNANGTIMYMPVYASTTA